MLTIKSLGLSILLLFITVFSFAQTNRPDAILMDEDLIITYDEDGNITEKVIRKYKVLNKRGKEISRFYEYYDDNVSINDLKISLYDASYRRIDPKNVNQLSDLSEYSNYASFTDNRIKFNTVKLNSYPYYIVYSYTKKYKGNLMKAAWYPQAYNVLEVRHAKLVLHVHESIELRYKSFNLKEVKRNEQGMAYKSYEFSIDSVKAFTYEPYSPPDYERYPVVFFTPINFNYDGFEGSFISWNSFGTWIYNLNQGRNTLDESARNDLKELVKGISDTTEMVKAVYQYMQNNTRYVSIQFGIGGFQPFLASYVDEYGYGDCKALSYYTKSLLDYLGIRSNYTLVRAGNNEQDIQLDFPSNQFNHVILNVPLKTDTIWLECTDQNLPFGYLSNFTSNRHVLSISKDESHIVKTPNYSKENNFQRSVSTFTIDDEGNAEASALSYNQGLFFDELSSLIYSDKATQEKWIYAHSELKDFDLKGFDVSYGGDMTPFAQLDYLCTINRFATLSGKRMFISINGESRFEKLPTNDSNRMNDIVIRNALSISDSSVFIVPPQYTIEYLPESLNLESEFGIYRRKLVFEEGKITYTHYIEVEKGRFKSSSYPSFVSFYNELIKSDKIVLKKILQ